MKAHAFLGSQGATAFTAIVILYLFASATSIVAQITPSGGLTSAGVQPGASIKIGWPTYIESAHVDIYLWCASTSRRIDIAQDVVASIGEFQWTVPHDIPTGSRYRFVVASTSNRDMRWMSASWVRIGDPVIDNQPMQPFEPGSIALFKERTSVRKNDIVVAPHPARDIVRIRFTSDFNAMRLVSLDGSKVLERKLWAGEKTVDVDVQHLSPGVYTVVLETEDGRCATSSLHVVP